MNMVDVTECPLCGSKAHAPYKGVGISPNFTADVPEFGVVRVGILSQYKTCLACGLVFQSPRPDDESVKHYYESNLYGRTLASNPDEQAEGEENRANRILPLVLKLNPKSFLDIGSGVGKLLDGVRDNTNIELCEGVEPIAERNKSKCTVFSSTDYLFRWYDVITCIHSLEHVSDLRKTLKDIDSVLQGGGRLIIEVPSEDSPGGPLRLGHLYLFYPWVLFKMFPDYKVIHFEKNPHYLIVYEKPNNSV